MTNNYDYICRKIGEHYLEAEIIFNYIVFEPSAINLSELTEFVKSHLERGALVTHELVGVSWLSGESGYVLRHRCSGHIADQDIIDAFEHSRNLERMINSPIESVAKQAAL